MSLRFTLLLIVATSGCTQQTGIGGPCAPFSNNSEEPCREQIYFPSGLAVDPDGDVLYVASSNADLRYSGGSVQSIDLTRHDCAARFFRDGVLDATCANLSYVLADANGNPFPTATPLGAPDPRDTSRTLVESDALGCSHDLLDPQIVQCDETPFITSAVKIGNFSGLLRVQVRRKGDYSFPADAEVPDAGTEMVTTTATSKFNRRLWLPVRGDPSITFINVDKPYDGTLPGDAFKSAAHLDCTDSGNGNPSQNLNSCNSQRITLRDFHRLGMESFPSCTMDEDCPFSATCSSGTCTTVAVPPEPFGLFLDEGPVGKNGDPAYSRLLVSHLAGGQVSLINSAAFNPASTDTITPKEAVVLDVTNGLFTPDASGRQGAFSLAPLTPGDPNSLWYVTSRLNATISMFQVSPENRILQAGNFAISAGPYLTGADVRDLAIQADGARGFFIDNQPPSLFTVDTRTIASSGSDNAFPANQVVDIVNVCQGPSNLATRTFVEPGATGAPPRTVTRVYVICFTTGQIAVVDPDLGLVVDNILVGSGPNDLGFNFGGPGQPVPPHLRGYVADYTDSSIAVIDLDRGSPTENRVIFRIGRSQPPVTM
jgi:hypothetical protein